MAMSNSVKSQLANDEYLTHYWPMSCGAMNDVIDHADMQQGFNTSFVTDKLGNLNSALDLNGGWTYLQTGVYFDTPEFTISFWVYPQQIGYYSKAIDFSGDIVLSFDHDSSRQPYFKINTGSSSGIAWSSQALILYQWQFIAATFDGNNMLLFIDGVQVGSCALIYTLPTLCRTSNYIGQSYSPGNDYSYSYMDDLRFYNKSLTQTEIGALMNVSPTTIGKSLY